MLSRTAYQIGWICAIEPELIAVQAVLDKLHSKLPAIAGDKNNYTFGEINKHNVVIACLPSGQHGTNAAAVVATEMRRSFPNLRFNLLVGVGGGVPRFTNDPSTTKDIRLGDIVVSHPTGLHGGVIQFDMGKKLEGKLELKRTGILDKPPKELLNAVVSLKADMRHDPQILPKILGEATVKCAHLLPEYAYQGIEHDLLLQADPEPGLGRAEVIRHPRSSTAPLIFYGTIASGNQVMKDDTTRDYWAVKESILCFEMEAAGLMDDFKCIVIRGISDYCNAEKDKRWQAYAALTAAVYAKALLGTIAAEDMEQVETSISVLGLEDAPIGTHLKAPNTVPFSRDGDFVSRDGIFEKLDSILSSASHYRWAALYGLGGIGKSQIAIEYAYRSHAANYNLNVFWIYANTIAGILSSVTDILASLHLPGHDDSKTDKILLLGKWLKDQNNGEWLVVLDNVDDFSVINTPSFDEKRHDEPQSDNSRTPLIGSIPQCSHGQVLVTSRDKKTAMSIVRSDKSLVHVQHMNHEESISLLKCRIQIQPQEETAASQLIEALAFIPLAISQAGAYLQQTPWEDIEGYLAEFTRNESSQTSLLTENQEELRRDRSVPNSVILAWEISFRRLQSTNPKAVETLFLICHFYRQGIPLELASIYDERQTRDAIRLLEGFSFITVSKTSVLGSSKPGIILNLHRLIQLATKKSLTACNRLSEWENKALGKILEIFVEPAIESSWQQLEALLPHVEQVLRHEPSGECDHLNRGLLCKRLSHHDLDMGRYDLAVIRAEGCRQNYEEHLEENDERQMEWRSLLSIAYQKRGRLDDAVRFRMEAKHMSETKFGPKHLVTIGHLNSLASIYEDQGRLDEAEEIQLRVVEARKLDPGPDHLITLLSMHNLAFFYLARGRLDEAEKLQLDLLEIQKTKLGSDHEATLNAMTNLAATYYNQGRFAEAEVLEKQTMDSSILSRGPDHPRTLTSINNLAQTYSAQGRWGEAEPLQVQVLKDSKTKNGPDHIHTLHCMTNLASTYFNQEHFDKAQPLQEYVEQKCRAIFGSHHPETLKSINNLAMTYYKQDRKIETERLMRQLVEAYKVNLGAEHPSTLTSMNNLAWTLAGIGNLEEAKIMMVEVIELRKSSLRKDHPDTIASEELLHLWSNHK